ncbi:MAG: pyruvate, phosphate dikinase [Acidimicrobiaceae bacterium]|nr:pyruvate, phosphate dikinase [Acidimicrobiaceae bacterium]
MSNTRISTRQELIDRVVAASNSGSAEMVLDVVQNVAPELVDRLLHAEITSPAATPLGSGLGVSPGAVSGEIVTSAAHALQKSDEGRSVILVRPVTTPDDVLGMQASAGIVTMHGGMSSHAAVVARGWGIPAVVGSSDVEVVGSTVKIHDAEFVEGDIISIDGRAGTIYRGAIDTDQQQVPPELWQLLDWADTIANGVVSIRANADTGHDARRSLEHGAVGIGLCRTEHMFLTDDRLPIMRSFILTDDAETQDGLLNDLEQAQERDFDELLDVMRERPVTIRLLDPPLHEFLPAADELFVSQGAGELNYEGNEILDAVVKLREVNPMLGTRGVRLGAIRAGLYEAQVRSLCRAALNAISGGRHPRIEVIIPFINDPAEFRLAREWVRGAKAEVDPEGMLDDSLTVGAMIETPRAALLAREIAQDADFFSFGTNDLTQMTFGLSRDDVETRLLPRYRSLGLIDDNPFEVLDQVAVGTLIANAISDARKEKPSINIGVCGEHAGDPRSIAFFIGAGCTSLSCSPYRVPVTRLVAAQTVLQSDSTAVSEETFFPDAPAMENAQTESTQDQTSDGEVGIESITDIDVLRVLRLRGFATSDGLWRSIGVDPYQVVERLVADGQVNFIEARNMYMLTPSGRSRIDDHLAASDPIIELSSTYESFLSMNIDFKQVCTDWQVRHGEPNPHDDDDYDAACITRLREVYMRSEAVISALANAVPRLDLYRRRLLEALTAIDDGQSQRFTGVMCESFHDVWMELHEDLIVLQKIDRVSEGSF